MCAAVCESAGLALLLLCLCSFLGVDCFSLEVTSTFLTTHLQHCPGGPGDSMGSASDLCVLEALAFIFSLLLPSGQRLP